MKPASLEILPSGPNAGRVAFTVELDEEGDEVNLNFLRADADAVNASYARIVGRNPQLHPQIWKVLVVLKGMFEHVTVEISGKVSSEALDLFREPHPGTPPLGCSDLSLILTVVAADFAHFSDKTMLRLLGHHRVLFRFHLGYNEAMPEWERLVAPRRIWVAAKVNSPENIAYVKRIAPRCNYGFFTTFSKEQP